MAFFNLLDKPIERGDEWETQKKRHDCVSCGRAGHCKFPKAPAIGSGENPVLFIGPAISKVEDTSKDEEHGSFYSLLKRYVKRVGIRLDSCLYTHAVKCFSKDKPKPTTKEVCHRKLMAQIQELKPKVIVPTCEEAWDILLYDRKKGRAAFSSFFDYAGEVIPDQVFNAWVCPIYDVGMMAKSAGYHDKFEPFATKHINTVFSMVDIPVPILNCNDHVKTTENPSQAIAWLKEATTWANVVFDYETSGLKPHRKGQKIVCISVSNGEVSYAFPNFPTDAFQAQWRSFLSSNVNKIAHNASFERTWSRNIFGVDPVNLQNDTMIAQHCLHNKKPTGLKYCAYARYGVMGYETHESLLKSKSDEKRKYGANAFNSIDEFPLGELLHYCGLDSLFEYWLFRDIVQNELDEEHELPGYKFMMKGIRAFDDMTEGGISIDIEYLDKLQPTLEKKIEQYRSTIMGSTTLRNIWLDFSIFNPQSDDDVRRLLFSLLKEEPIEFTEGGQPSVDEESLSYYAMKHPFLEDLLQLRRWNKVVGTYFRQLRAEAVNGIVHANFLLHSTATYRPSVRNPNLANISKRDKEVMGIIRTAIKPKAGHKIIEYDVSALEVRINAALSGDKNLIKYVCDPTSDMHKHLTAKTFFLPENAVKKPLRNIVKNQITFPMFYGSSGRKCASNLYDLVMGDTTEKLFDINLREHLAKHDIRSYEDWEAHIVTIEKYLWEKMFPDYMKYRKELFASFCEKGYIDYPNGFRYKGPASYTESTNGPTQGSGFHVQLWSFIQVSDKIRERGMDVQPINNVYDSMAFSCNPLDEDWLDRLVYEWGCIRVMKQFPWLSVPIVYEKEASIVNGTWADMKGFGELKDSWGLKE